MAEDFQRQKSAVRYAGLNYGLAGRLLGMVCRDEEARRTSRHTARVGFGGKRENPNMYAVRIRLNTSLYD